MKNDSDINEEEIYQLYLGHGGVALCIDRKSYYLKIRNSAQIPSTQVVSSEDLGWVVRKTKKNYKLLQLIRRFTPKTWSVWLMGYGLMLLHKTSIKQENAITFTADGRDPDKCDMIYTLIGVMEAEEVPNLVEFYDWCNRKAETVNSNFDFYKGKTDYSWDLGFEIGKIHGAFHVRKKEK